VRPTTVADVAQMAVAAVRGREDRLVTGVATDSRAVLPGDLFVALPGTRAHGAEFAGEAAARGAAAILVDAAHEQEASAASSDGGVGPTPVLVSDDALAALGRLAGSYRSTLPAKVVGITGSTGKTTTKDMLAAALSSLSVVASEKSQNNDIGAPLTLLAATPETDVIVVEMAMRGPGQIRRLARMAAPEVGIVTNVGVTHFELLGSREAIADAKAELLEELPDEGVAILNGDDDFLAHLRSRTRAKVITYGLDPRSDIVAAEIRTTDRGRVTFLARNGMGQAAVELPVPGRHNAYNALAALAAAKWLGLDLEQAAKGLASVELSPMRMEVFTTPDSVTVVNDTYNANPTSMAAALDVLADLAPQGGRRVAVLGTMSELGGLSGQEHASIGRKVRDLGVELLITVGGEARVIGEAAAAAGGPEWVHVGDAEEAAADVPGRLKAGDTVLVKGSRSVGLERVVEEIAG
jgi:UDP-N-acetylmuramoyl-tripeptide--D-alanyl-D-alanine ligase